MSKKPVTRMNQSLTFFFEIPSPWSKLEIWNSKFLCNRAHSFAYAVLVERRQLEKILCEKNHASESIICTCLKVFFSPTYLNICCLWLHKRRKIYAMIHNSSATNPFPMCSELNHTSSKSIWRRQRLIVSQSHSVTFVLRAQVMWWRHKLLPCRVERGDLQRFGYLFILVTTGKYKTRTTVGKPHLISPQTVFNAWDRVFIPIPVRNLEYRVVHKFNPQG